MSTALEARLAAMEAELAGFRSASRSAPQAPAFDAAAFRRAFVANPIGVLAQLGVTDTELQHIQRVHVAHQLGDNAPPELKALAQMGPQISATNSLASDLAAISRRLDDREAKETQQSVRASFATLAADKAKYPHLATAYAADPSLFDNEVAGFSGNAMELATALEARQAKIAALYKPAQPASQTAENQTESPLNDEPGDEPEEADPSLQVSTPALAGTMSGDVPPLPQTKAGLFSAEEDSKLRAQILAKYSPGE